MFFSFIIVAGDVVIGGAVVVLIGQQYLICIKGWLHESFVYYFEAASNILYVGFPFLLFSGGIDELFHLEVIIKF